MNMRVGSLFTGYGGLDIAVGGDLAWYAEIEPAACQVLAHHYPNVPNLGDITKINWADVEPVDVITGGYPCQPFSHAGNRKGKNDERHLWPNVLDAIRAIRPQYAILENVSGHRTLGFADVLADLAEIGWSCEWGTFRASDVGAPHRRERLFIIAYPANASGDGHGQQLHARAMASMEGQATGSPQQRQRSRRESDARGVHDVADTEGEGLQRRGAAAEDKQRKLAGRRTTSKGNCDAAATNWGKYAPTIQRWKSVLDRPAPAPTVIRNDKRRLNPQFVEWMMGLPDGWVTGHGLSAAKELKMLGNGVVPQQAHAAIRQLLERTQQ